MTDLKGQWEELRARGPDTTKSRYTLAFQSGTTSIRFFLAIRWPEGTPSVVLEAPASAFPRTGLNFRTRAFVAAAGRFEGLPESNRGLVLDLVDPESNDQFAFLATSLLTTIASATSPTEALSLIASCLARWRRFFERGGGLLSADEARGLYGELIVLGRLARKRSPSEALAGWAAPGGAVRDFELPDLTIEVKTYQSATGASLRINDPAQLDEAPGRPLYLAAVRMAESDEGVTLPEAVMAVRGLFCSDAVAAEGFDEALAKCGFLREHAALYTTKLVAGPLTLHAVESGFPRIRPEDVMPGVERVQFSVPLGAMTPFRREPDAVVGSALAGVEGER